MCRITFPGLKIMYIILTTPVALILLVYSIYKWIMRQSDREKEFWIDQKVYGHPVSLKLYALMKADYTAMRTMIYGDYISFEELLNELRSLENEINSL